VKDQLCKAFCDQLQIRELPTGYAVRTGFALSDGEPLGFYIVGPDGSGRFRIEDDGTTIPMIEAAGVDLSTQTRADAVEALLREYGASYDDERGELCTAPLPTVAVPSAALKFVALLLRLQDLVLLTPERVSSSFREDAVKAIREALGGRAEIAENEPISSGIEFPADVIVRASGRIPVAIFLAMSEQRVLEAVIAQMAALYESKAECSVIALLEKDTSVSKKMRRYAANRLTAMPIFDGDERAAIQRIEREAIGSTSMLH